MNKHLDERSWQGGFSEQSAITGTKQIGTTLAASRVVPFFRSSEPDTKSNNRQTDMLAPRSTDERIDPADEILCRRLGPLDLRFLASNVNAAHLDQPNSFTSRSGSLMTAIEGIRPFRRLNPITNLAFSKQGLFLGFVQFRQAMPDRRWIAGGVGVAEGFFESDRVVEKLLEYSFVRAGSRGVKRLFARVPDGSALMDPFRRTGFESYMRESLYLSNRPLAPIALNKQVREQEQSDTWAVHQLYHASVPRHVQFAEAWTSHRWDLEPSRRDAGSWRSYVMEEESQVIAYARVQIGNRTAVIEVMYLAERRDRGIELCQDVIGRLSSQSGINRIFVTVKAHQVELESALIALGLECIGSQELMVRYTTAKVTVPAVESTFAVTQDVLERVPKRVPTYLNRHISEESMP